jgi:hypothetical protein
MICCETIRRVVAASSSKRGSVELAGVGNHKGKMEWSEDREKSCKRNVLWGVWCAREGWKAVGL